ncbi:stage III sporulation protein AE [Clostridium sp. CAG:1219]|nr:stage III sporulation protein AE [Clostridium sp. CAG:1219]
MNKKVLYTIVGVIILFFITSDIYGVDDNKSNVTEEIKENFGLPAYLDSIGECIQEANISEFNISDFSNDLISGRGIGYNKIFQNIISLLGKEIFISLKSAILILIIILLMAILNGINENSQILNIVYLVCFIAIASITIGNFTQIISMFKNTSDILSKIVQIVSPFLIAILIGTGAITSTGLIQPLILFMASLIGFIITYIIIPCISVSVALNVISSMSDNFKFNELSKMFSKCAIWIIGIVLTLFLGILSLETTLSASVDSLTVNVTQAAFSNFIPVVGKFFSDSLETVIGTSKIIGKAGGVVGIVSMVVISSVPIIKIASVCIVYYLLAAISEIVCKEEKIKKYIKGFGDVYKTLLGILIGINILFIISIGIIINLCGKIGT